MHDQLFDYNTLFAFTQAAFEKLGVPQAELATEVLLSADLRGIDSHGIARLSGYIRLIQAGRIYPQAKPFVVHASPSTATVDGDKGLGLIVAPYAMQVAIDKPK